jgi:hypothetical protein|tara:strand:- start:46 stop:489 length:444 start_codon:yes stop_codon:yes gene_type:complete
MSSIHLYQAEKKDVESVYDLLIEFKEFDLKDAELPEIDRDKLLNCINVILKKGKIILAKDLDKKELMGLCMFHKSEYWFSKQQLMNIHVLYIRKNYRNFKLVKTIIDSVKNVSEGLPITISVTSGLHIDPVFEKLGFQNMGSNWRLL